jgi:hypothetical protein
VDDSTFGLCSGCFQANVLAQPGQAVIIEASTNLVNWEAVQTILVDTTGISLFSDTNSGAFLARFYRARVQ